MDGRRLTPDDVARLLPTRSEYKAHQLRHTNTGFKSRAARAGVTDSFRKQLKETNPRATAMRERLGLKSAGDGVRKLRRGVLTFGTPGLGKPISSVHYELYIEKVISPVAENKEKDKMRL
jgi:hypothetical protein